LELNEEIGEGFFGKVYIAKWNSRTVAAKKLNSASQKFDTEFWQEVDVLLGLTHKNILKFLGVSNMNGDKYLLTQFANRGSVKSYLSEKNKLNVRPSLIVQMARDTAQGMAFISRLNIVHRDLAVRNLLCSESNNQLIVMVSDFGLSRKSEGNTLTISDKSADPIRWAAPEAFGGIVSTKSDVWSFGVTMWELFTFCSEPYPGLTNSQVKQTVTSGKSVLEYFKLDDVPAGINELVANCLEFEPTKRPTFREAVESLQKILDTLQADSSLNEWKMLDSSLVGGTDLGEGTYETADTAEYESH